MKILIINLHSALNLGDDAIMRSTLDTLRRQHPQVTITAAANDPTSWRKYEDIEVVGSLATWVYRLEAGRWRGRLWVLPLLFVALPLLAAGMRYFRLRGFGSPLLNAYREADLILSCGGGNFYAHKRFSPFLLLALLALAFPLWLGKRVVMLPQSIGPIEGWVQRAAARYVFNRVHRIYAREARTIAFLREMLHAQLDIRGMPDLAFGLPGATPSAADGAAFRVAMTVIDRGRQHRGFNRQGAYESALVGLCERLAAQRPALAVTLICQVRGPTLDQDDRLAAERLAEALVGRGIKARVAADFTDAREVIEACARADLVIASRMHTAIFALLSATPVVVLAYQPKALGLMADLRLEEFCLAMEDASAEVLMQAAEKALNAQERFRAAVAAGVGAHRHQLTKLPAEILEEA